MKQTELKANGLCVVFKTNEWCLNLWKTAIFKRAEYLPDETTCVGLMYVHNFDSVKLQVVDKDDIKTYNMQCFNTGSITV